MSTDELNKVQKKGLGAGFGSTLEPQAGAGDALPGSNPRRRSTLGKGLGALLGEAADDYAQLDQVRPAKSNIALDLLAPSPFQPRKHFDAVALADLAQSIREKGIIQPLVVRRDPHRAGHFQIIAGERRWRAAQQAGLHEAPVVVREYSDTQAMEVAIIENVQRQDLNPIEEAQGYARLHKEFGHTQEEVARLVGKSRAHVANTIRLLQLPPLAQQALAKGGLTAGHARALLTAIKDPAFLEKLVNEGFDGTVREAEQLARDVRAEAGVPEGGKKHQGVKLRDANIVQLEKELAVQLGLKVSIMGKGQSGTLMIKYQNLDQLDDVLKKLCGTAVRA
jgi:ParB family transcriptional regulator, chromosome partitioning protein